MMGYAKFGAVVLFAVGLTWSCGEDRPRVDVDLQREAGYAGGGDLPAKESRPAGSAWPQWRGPYRNGTAPQAEIRTDWKSHPPTVRWRVPLGEGFSAFSIAHDRAYTLFSAGGDEFAVCLDAATGREVWRHRTGKEFRDWQGGNGPRSTPLIDGDMAFCLSANGVVYALNARDGTEIWSCDLRDKFAAKVPQWGFSGSPLCDEKYLYLEAGGKNGQALVAFEKSTGRVAWTSQSDITGYSSPVFATVDGIRQVIFFTGANVVSLNPQNGQLFWKTPWETAYDVNAATPVFIPPNQLFISSEYDVGGALFEMSARDNRVTVRQVWKNREMKNKMATSVYHEGYLYGFDSSFLKCLDARTGAERWKARGLGEGTLILAGQHLLVLSDRGELLRVPADPAEYRETDVVKVLDGRCWTAPALAGGFLYLRNLKEAVCLDLRPVESL